MERLLIFAHGSADEAAQAAADEVAELIKAFIAFRGGCRWALAGGRTPQPLYRALARRDDIAWEQVHFFWGDERCVALDDPQSNARMVREALLDHLPVAATQVHVMETWRGGGGAAAAHYEGLLGRVPLDLVLLGMGADGHTASLFPGDGALACGSGLWVSEAKAPAPPYERLTLSVAALRAAREIRFLVSGADKGPALAQVVAELSTGQALLPAAQVALGRATTWHIDAAAAAQLGPDRARS